MNLIYVMVWIFALKYILIDFFFHANYKDRLANLLWRVVLLMNGVGNIFYCGTKEWMFVIKI